MAVAHFGGTVTAHNSTRSEPPLTPGPPAAPGVPVPAGWLRDRVMMLLGRDLAEFTIARLTVHDLPDIGGALGSDAAADLLARVGQRLADRLRPGEAWMTRSDGDFMVLLTEATPSRARRRITDLVHGCSGWTPEAYGSSLPAPRRRTTPPAPTTSSPAPTWPLPRPLAAVPAP